MGILLSIPQSERAKKGRKSPHILPPFFDFRGADFDMTTDDTEGTYFKYLPFGEDEEGRKMPYKIENRETQFVSSTNSATPSCSARSGLQYGS